MRSRLKRVCLAISSVVVASLLCTLPSLAELDLEAASGIWLFDDGDDAVATDLTKNGNDGELMNGPTYVDGKYGKAIEFDGVNQYVSMANPVGLPEGAAPRTVMLAFKWSEVKWPAPGVEPMGYGSNANGKRVGMWIDAGGAVGVETVNFGVVTDWSGDTDWHHLAVAFPDGETSTDKFKVYWDGKFEAGRVIGAPQNIATSPAPLTIGVLPQALVYYFNGIIDEVAIFPVELSADDIAAIAKRGLEEAQAVSPSGKLATAWGTLKAQ